MAYMAAAAAARLAAPRGRRRVGGPVGVQEVPAIHDLNWSGDVEPRCALREIVLDEHVLDFLSVLLLPRSSVLEELELGLLALFVQLINFPPVLVEQLVPLRSPSPLRRGESLFCCGLATRYGGWRR